MKNVLLKFLIIICIESHLQRNVCAVKHLVEKETNLKKPVSLEVFVSHLKKANKKYQTTGVQTTRHELASQLGLSYAACKIKLLSLSLPYREKFIQCISHKEKKSSKEWMEQISRCIKENPAISAPELRKCLGIQFVTSMIKKMYQNPQYRPLFENEQCKLKEFICPDHKLIEEDKEKFNPLLKKDYLIKVQDLIAEHQLSGQKLTRQQAAKKIGVSYDIFNQRMRTLSQPMHCNLLRCLNTFTKKKQAIPKIIKILEKNPRISYQDLSIETSIPYDRLLSLLEEIEENPEHKELIQQKIPARKKKYTFPKIKATLKKDPSVSYQKLVIKANIPHNKINFFMKKASEIAQYKDLVHEKVALYKIEKKKMAAFLEKIKEQDKTRSSLEEYAQFMSLDLSQACDTLSQMYQLQSHKKVIHNCFALEEFGFSEMEEPETQSWLLHLQKAIQLTTLSFQQCLSDFYVQKHLFFFDAQEISQMLKIPTILFYEFSEKKESLDSQKAKDFLEEEQTTWGLEVNSVYLKNSIQNFAQMLEKLTLILQRTLEWEFIQTSREVQKQPFKKIAQALNVPEQLFSFVLQKCPPQKQMFYSNFIQTM
jgi:hypothetical protein